MALAFIFVMFKEENLRKGDRVMASITINTNLASLTAQKNLSNATTGMNKAMERLSTKLTQALTMQQDLRYQL